MKEVAVTPATLRARIVRAVRVDSEGDAFWGLEEDGGVTEEDSSPNSMSFIVLLSYRIFDFS